VYVVCVCRQCACDVCVVYVRMYGMSVLCVCLCVGGVCVCLSVFCVCQRDCVSVCACECVSVVCV
jgi:hypothetical protein